MEEYDLNLPIRQEPMVGKEGALAAENALSNAQNSIDYNTVPWIIFTDPQLAGIGFYQRRTDGAVRRMFMQDCFICQCLQHSQRQLKLLRYHLLNIFQN
ncbi:hypothetical protein HYW46_05190 [Candidatus Daviesbacteria bacterium]|nr:hypothetical protein [Candidatus Daviesbacteria bacterium]